MQIEATEKSISFKIHVDISWYIEIWLDEQENAFINYQLQYDKIYFKLILTVFEKCLDIVA